MDKIESIGNRYPFKKSQKKKGSAKSLPSGPSFRSVLDAEPGAQPLSDAGSFSIPENATLEGLLDEVYEIGEKLKETPSLETIGEYRRTVKVFLKFVLDRMLSLDEKTSGHNILRRKRFTTVRIIDKKLESLVAEVLRGQTLQIRILERVNEIHGLIIDIVS